MSVEGKAASLEVLVKRAGQPYLRVTLDRSPAVIGRGTSADVRLDSPKVSRTHARLEFSGREVRILDAGSRNGFRVDGEQTRSAPITSKNSVELADFEFRVRLTSSPRMPPGSPHYYSQGSAEPRGELVPEPADSRSGTVELEDELSEGWAEIEREGAEDTHITRRPAVDWEREAPKRLSDGERSVMNQLRFARSHADLEAAVGDELDQEDADEYLRPDLEPLLKTLHGETEQLVPTGRETDVAVEVIFAMGASIEDTALLSPGERYWWGGKPGPLGERFLVPSETRFPLVSHLRDGTFLVDVPQHSTWKLFRKGKGAPPAHRTGVLMGIAAGRDEQVEISYGPFTFYVRCVTVPARVHRHGSTWRAPDRRAFSAIIASTVLHAALMAVPVAPLPTLSSGRAAPDRFVDFVASDLNLEFPESQAPLPSEPPPMEPEEPEPPAAEDTRPEVDLSEDTSQQRQTRRRPPERAAADETRSGETPSGETRSGETPSGETAADARTDDAPSPSRGELSVADFKVTGMIEHLPTVKIDPARGPKPRSGAPILRGEGAGVVGILDKSGQGMSLTPPGRLTKTELRRVVNTNSRDIGRCQARAQKAHPGLNGKLVLQWTVLPDGGTSDTRVIYDDLGSPEFTNCAKAAVRTWIFPEPRGGAATVTYPFKVRNLNL